LIARRTLVDSCHSTPHSSQFACLLSSSRGVSALLWANNEVNLIMFPESLVPQSDVPIINIDQLPVQNRV
jgi:hypothetical protein